MKAFSPLLEDTKNISAESIRTLVSSLSQYFGPASRNMDFVAETFWKDFEKKIFFIKNDTVLQYSQDANSPIALPDGCEIVQIAFWHESSGPSEEGTLLVNQKHWEKLDQLNKVALLAHEFFYKQARLVGHKNSDFIRKKIGELLSKKGLTPIFNEWIQSSDDRVSNLLPKSMKGFKYCIGESQENPSTKFQLYQYEGSDKLQHLVIPIMYGGNIGISLLQYLHKSFDPKSNQDLAKKTDLLAIQSKYSDTSKISPRKLQPFEFYELNPFQLQQYSLQSFSFLFQHGDANWLYPDAFRNFYKSISKENLAYSLDSDKPEIWSANISTANSNLEFSLSSFEKNSVKKAAPKSVSDFIKDTNSKIEDIIKANYVAEKYSQNIEKVSNAIVTLNYEIDNAIHSGVQLSEFPKWSSAINNLDEFIQGIPPNGMNGEKNERLLELLRKVLPAVLFKAKLAQFLQVETNDLLHVDGSYNFIEDNFANKDTIETKMATVKLKDNNESLTFRVSCKNYNDLYLDETRHDTEANSKVPPNPNLKFTVASDVKLPDLKIVFNQLYSIEEKIFNKDNISDSKSIFCLSPVHNIFPLGCRSAILLVKDLKRESHVEATACHQSFWDYSDVRDQSEYEHLCVRLRLISTRRSYILYGKSEIIDKGKSDLKYLFIQEVPFSYEQEFLQ